MQEVDKFGDCDQKQDRMGCDGAASGDKRCRRKVTQDNGSSDLHSNGGCEYRARYRATNNARLPVCARNQPESDRLTQ